MIAIARLGGAEQRVSAARAYAHTIRAILADLAAAGHRPRELASLQTPRDVKRDLYIVFASDRGMAGSFNHNLVQATLAAMGRHRATEHTVMPIGRRGLQYFRRLGVPLTKGYTSVSAETSYRLAAAIATEVSRDYAGRVYDEVFLVYNEFVNALVQRPTVLRLLPLSPEEWTPAEPQSIYDYLPSSQAVLDRLIPRFLEAQVYWAAIQSRASEHGARLTAMGTATENAEEMLHRLTLSLHRARQTQVTAELAEIVGGRADTGGG